MVRMDPLIDLLRKYALPDLTPGYVRDFHKSVLEAVADGKLTEEEIASLERRKEVLGISDDALSAVKQDMYAAAFAHIKQNVDVTDEEWEEMEQIQDFLGLKDSDIAKTKRALYRLRILTELKKGNLPVISTEEIITERDEMVYWSEPVEVWKASSGDISPRKVSDTVASTDGWDHIDDGVLFITSSRVIIKGRKETRAHKLKQIIGVKAYVNGVELHVNRHNPLLLIYTHKGNHNVVGSILEAATARSKMSD
jgi:hypothetical protein